MKFHSRVPLLSLVALIWIWPANICVDDTLVAADHNKQDDPPSNERNLDEAAKPKQTDTGEDRDMKKAKAQDNSESKKGTDRNAGRQDADSLPVAAIEEVSVYIYNADDDPVESAKVALSSNEDISLFKKIIDDEGVAIFKNLPAARMDVKVTAPGYRSYVGEVDLESGAVKINIVLRKRD